MTICEAMEQDAWPQRPSKHLPSNQYQFRHLLHTFCKGAVLWVFLSRMGELLCKDAVTSEGISHPWEQLIELDL